MQYFFDPGSSYPTTSSDFSLKSGAKIRFKKPEQRRIPDISTTHLILESHVQYVHSMNVTDSYMSWHHLKPWNNFEVIGASNNYHQLVPPVTVKVPHACITVKVPHACPLDFRSKIVSILEQLRRVQYQAASSWNWNDFMCVKKCSRSEILRQHYSIHNEQSHTY
jgi:hypothetical protein